MRLLPLLAAAVLTTSACTATPSDGDPAPDGSTSPVAAPSRPGAATPSPAPPDATPAPGTAPTPTPTPTPPSAVCPPEDRQVMADAVLGQLDAIAAGDWPGALAFTSTAFRAGVDAEAFERIIVDGFPVVATNVAADVSACQLGASTVASVLVTVEDADGTQQDLVYLFEREQDTWRIGGAVPAASRSTDGGFTV